MADRPLGLEPFYKREFDVHIPAEPVTRRERLSEWWYHVKTFSFSRGTTIELELEDDMIEFLFRTGWIRRRGDQLFFTRKGSSELVEFCRSCIAEKNDD